MVFEKQTCKGHITPSPSSGGDLELNRLNTLCRLLYGVLWGNRQASIAPVINNQYFYIYNNKTNFCCYWPMDWYKSCTIDTCHSPLKKLCKSRHKLVIRFSSGAPPLDGEAVSCLEHSLFFKNHNRAHLQDFEVRNFDALFHREYFKSQNIK